MNNGILTSRRLCRILVVLFLMLLTAEAQLASAQVKGEYFWNEDPGIGKATPTGAAITDGEWSAFEIDADKIPAGMNILGMRAFTGGRWSQTVTYTVMGPAKTNSADWRAEYFWDNDPGVGKATPIATALGQDGGDIEADLSTEGLNPGRHLLGFRTCSGKAWSQTVTSTVFIGEPRQYDIIGAEYFWGKDPGFGKGTPIELTPGDMVDIESLEIDFPTEKSDEYVLSFRARSEKGWGLTQTTVIPHLYVEKIELTAEKDMLVPGETMSINAELTPADAFETGLEWTSSNPEVATVANDGTVTGVAPGKVTITARATDGSEASDTCMVTVAYLRGDANGDGLLAVNDVVLTARGVVNDIDQSLIFEAVDMNADDKLTVGDLTQVVDAVISYDAPAPMSGHSRVRVSDEAYGAAPLLLTQSGWDICVAFDNDARFAGVQFDVETEDGLTVESVTLDYPSSQTHSVANHRFEYGTLRMLAYGIEPLPADRVFATIHTDTKSAESLRLIVTNVLATDLQGNLYRLPDSEVNLDDATAIDRVDDDGLRISVEGHTLVITSSVDTNLMITDMKGMTTRVVVKTGVTRYTVPVDGIYIVNNQKIIIR